jgi:hypothetical protein
LFPCLLPKSVKFKVNKTEMSFVILYLCGAWSLPFGEFRREHADNRGL